MSVNSISANGITIQTFADVVAEILNGVAPYPGLLSTYGPGLVLNPNSADSQMVNIYAQGKIDCLEQFVSLATSFDPDQAVGVLLDQRCAINGVFRQEGTYTLQQVTITVSQAVTLPGLDTAPNAPFTVADGSGNRYQLISSYSFPTAGSLALNFQAAVLGPVTSAPNTITVPVTIIAGVTSVNNPAGPTATGQAEETDPKYRLRRSNSVALPSKGWLQGMLAGLLNVPGVTGAQAFENKTNTTNSLGMPPHSIWLIVAGSPVHAQVGAAIYAKRNACVDWTNGGIGGTAHATISSGQVATIVVDTGGTGYDNPPVIKIVGGGGINATATASVSGGVIVSIGVNTAGSGYTSIPTIQINPNTVAVPITQINGSIFEVYYDTPIAEPLWFRATLTAITGTLDKPNIQQQVFSEFATDYGIAEAADTASIIAFIKSIAPNASVSVEGVSTDGSTYSTLVSPTNVNYQFYIPDLSHVTIS